MTFKEELQSRNWSIYGQWAGIISMILCFALGIANIFNFGHPLVIIFSAICLACSFLILFIEVPFLLRICPTSGKFDDFVRKFSTNYMRAAVYGIMSIVQFLSLIIVATSLIAAAVVLLITGAFYGVAAARKDEFMSSKTLGGQGVAQMIV